MFINIHKPFNLPAAPSFDRPTSANTPPRPPCRAAPSDQILSRLLSNSEYETAAEKFPHSEALGGKARGGAP